MNSSLTVTYVPNPLLAELEAYWLRLTQVLPESDAMTVSEAASLIDQAFELEPCEDGSMYGGGEEYPVDADPEDEESPLIPFEEFNFLVRSYLQFAGCQLDASGGYLAQVQVFRSHRDEPYTLNITGGEEVETVRVQEPVSETLQVDGASITCSYPVAGPVSVSAGTIKNVKGSTVNFTGIVGGSVTLSYLSEHDLVTIAVDPDPDNPGEPLGCTVFGFCHGMADDITLEEPQVDDTMTEVEKLQFCPNISVEIDPDRGSPTCYEVHTYVDRCRCSGALVDDSTTEREVNVECPEGLQCRSKDDCRIQVGSKLITAKYIVCEDEEGQDSCGDPDTAKELCCGKTPRVQPPCCTVKSVWRGGVEIDGGPDLYKALYGDNVRLVAVAPEDGICGNLIDRYQAPDACCDTVEDLEWDYDRSAGVIADNSSGVVFVSNGLGPYEWVLTGTGFFTDEALTRKSIFTADPKLTIYTANSCGSCQVQVSDRCSSVAEYVRSAVGQWVYRGGGNRNEEVPPVSGIPADSITCEFVYGGQPNVILTGVKGRYKCTQYYGQETQNGETSAEACANVDSQISDGKYPTIIDPHGVEGVVPTNCADPFGGVSGCGLGVNCAWAWSQKDEKHWHYQYSDTQWYCWRVGNMPYGDVWRQYWGCAWWEWVC